MQTGIVYEVWKRKQVHEDVRKMHRTKILVRKLGKMDKATFWEAMTWSEEWTV